MNKTKIRSSWACCHGSPDHEPWCPVPGVEALPELTPEAVQEACVELAKSYDSTAISGVSRPWVIALERMIAIGRRLARESKG